MTGDWSALYAGEVDLARPAPTTWLWVLTGQARLFLDDRLVVDAWSHPTTATVADSFTNAIAGRHRLRVDYAAQASATAGLSLHCTSPGGPTPRSQRPPFAPRYSAPPPR